MRLWYTIIGGQTKGMRLSARIDPRLRWFTPEWASLSAERTVIVRGRRVDYEVDALAAVREYAHTVRNDAMALQFVRNYGPLVEPVDGKVDIRDMIKAQRALVTIERQWRLFDAKALKDRRYTAAAFGAKLPPQKLLAAKAEYLASFLAEARLNTRLEWDSGGLILRPNDLQTAMWFVVASRIAAGDASIQCRNADCPNIVNRSLADGDSMRAVFCEERREACRKHVEREWVRGRKDADRYPQLRGLNATQFKNAARKLRGEEVR